MLFAHSLFRWIKLRPVFIARSHTQLDKLFNLKAQSFIDAIISQVIRDTSERDDRVGTGITLDIRGTDFYNVLRRLSTCY